MHTVGKTKNSRGFTIVELLIVIVVIAILAAITIVAYNGIQQRSQNTKSASAATAWLKALHLYKVENGSWPTIYNVCLGTGYKFGSDGAGSSGVAQCRQDTAGWGIQESTAFNTMLKKYIGESLPTPAFVTAVNTTDSWKRGISYYQAAGGSLRLDVTYAGSLSTCPSIGGVATTVINVWGGNTNCHYTIGAITDI
ncbi:MAG TPA: type II secretion system protein [Candidatus Saccharimonadales bacterium]